VARQAAGSLALHVRGSFRPLIELVIVHSSCSRFSRCRHYIVPRFEDSPYSPARSCLLTIRVHSQSSKKKKKKKTTGTAQEQPLASGIPAVCPQRTGRCFELTCTVQDDAPGDNTDPDGEDHPLLAKVICIIRRRPKQAVSHPFAISARRSRKPRQRTLCQHRQRNHQQHSQSRRASLL